MSSCHQTGGIAEYFSERFHATPNTLDPWPHRVVKKALPEKHFNYLLNCLPPPERYNRKKDYTGTRMLVLTRDLGKPWSSTVAAMATGLGYPSFKGILARDDPGFHLGPHTDTELKKMSIVLYISGDEGTQLLTTTKEPYTVVPFEPNTALCFGVTGESYHAIGPVKSRRDVLLVDIYHG